MALARYRKGRVLKYTHAQRSVSRRNLSLFDELIETPHDFGVINNMGAEFPLTLPGQGRLAISVSNPVTQGDILVEIGASRSFGTPDLDANELFKGVHGEKNMEVTISNSGATGDVSLYLFDDFGEYHLIGDGTLGPQVDFLLQENGDKILQEDGSRIVL